MAKEKTPAPKSPIQNPAAPEKKIFVKSINGRPMEVTYYQKQEPQLKEYPNAPLTLDKDITDAD